MISSSRLPDGQTYCSFPKRFSGSFPSAAYCSMALNKRPFSASVRTPITSAKSTRTFRYSIFSPPHSSSRIGSESSAWPPSSGGVSAQSGSPPRPGGCAPARSSQTLCSHSSCLLTFRWGLFRKPPHCKPKNRTPPEKVRKIDVFRLRSFFAANGEFSTGDSEWPPRTPLHGVSLYVWRYTVTVKCAKEKRGFRASRRGLFLIPLY